MSQTEVQLIKDAVIVNADVSNSAAIDVSKLSGVMPLSGGTFTSGVTFTGNNYNASWVRSADTFRFQDNAILGFGAADDLKIFHDGSNSRVAESGTGHLILTSNGNGVLIQDFSSGQNMAKFLNSGAVELYHNYNKKFETYTSGIEFFGNIKNETDGTNQGMFLGAANDFQFYHDGNRSAVNNRTGDLRLLGAGNIILGRADSGNSTAYDEQYISCNSNGAVELYHDNSKRFETTSTGSTVSSTGSSTELQIAASSGGTSIAKALFKGFRSAADNGSLGQIQFINQRDNDVQAKIDVVADGDSNAYIDVFASTANNRTFRIYSGSVAFPDNNKLVLGTGNDLKIYHDGSHSYIEDAGTGNLRVQTNNLRIENAAGTENQALFTENGAVELYYNNGKKFETLSDGVNVTGTLKVNGSPFTGGKILQVVAAETTNSASTSSSSFVDTNITANITPSSTSSKVLVMIDAPFHVIRSNGTSNSFEVKVQRNGSDITDTITSQNSTHQSGIGSGAISSNRSVGVLNKIILDSPSSTSQLTYKMTMGGAFSGNTVTFQDGCKSHITLMEVAA